MYVDRRGHWHVLAHTYVDAAYPAMSISGHGFSRDGRAWRYSSTEPYSGTVDVEGGVTRHYSTLERPKLLFADASDPLRPTHLLNGASPVWDAAAANPCGRCHAADGSAPGQCVKCKVTAGLDRTYTIVRPLAGPGLAQGGN